MIDTNAASTPNHRFPVELVAKYAAKFLQGRMGNEPILPDLPFGEKREPYSREALDKAALLSIRLLDACQYHLDADRANKLPVVSGAEWQRAVDRALEEASARFPSGGTWADGLSYITGEPREEVALPKYKRFLEWLEEISHDAAQERTTSMRSRPNVEIVFQASDLGVEKLQFSRWHDQINLPSIRRSAALQKKTHSGGKKPKLNPKE